MKDVLSQDARHATKRTVNIEDNQISKTITGTEDTPWKTTQRTT